MKIVTFTILIISNIYSLNIISNYIDFVYFCIRRLSETMEGREKEWITFKTVLCMITEKNTVKKKNYY
jgi:hypothetical protein